MREKTEFDNFFMLYHSQLYYFAMQYITDEEEAHDIVSAAYEDLWRNFATVKMSTVKQLLYTNVKNKCIDSLRRRKCHERYVEFTTIMSSDYISKHDSDKEYNEQIIGEIMKKIEYPTVDILRACYIDGKKYREVADEMGISISTVKKHMVKALKIIREMKKNMRKS